MNCPTTVMGWIALMQIHMTVVQLCAWVHMAVKMTIVPSMNSSYLAEATQGVQ
jgi:hypothetical protein